MTAAPTRALRILVADDDRQALRGVAAALRSLGHEVLALAVTPREAAEAVAREEPDVSVVKVNSDPGHALDLVAELASLRGGPVVALLDREDPDFVATAAAEGMHAYVAGPDADPAGLQGAIEVALCRHAEVAALSEKVTQLEGALDRRAVIERAKGILMERHGLADREAFELLRRHARNESRQVVAVAREVADGQPLPRPDRT